jgi:hypothetical protein
MPSDGFAVKVAVLVLAFIAIAGSVTIYALAMLERTIPEEVVASTAAAVTGTLGLLAATRTGPTDVVVQNEGPAEAIPVDETPRLAVRKRNP